MNIETTTATISGKIESIIREAQSEVVLVTPYVQLEKDSGEEWETIKKAIKFALDQNVNVSIYARQPNDGRVDSLKEKFAGFKSPRLKIYLVENLHAKVYSNGSEALLTSMNMYLHSTRNHEIGVSVQRKADPEEMAKIDKFIKYLNAESIVLQDEQEMAEQKKNLEQEAPGEIEKFTFRVFSKGYKWYTVETVEGYDDKISVEDVDLVVDKIYTAKGKKLWKSTPFGYSVQLTNMHDCVMYDGYCIACKKPVKGTFVLCYECNERKKSGAQVEMKYCRQCANVWIGIDMWHPRCRACYIESKNI